MLIKTKAIVISSIKYQEKSLIVKCFTASDGLKSYFVRNAFGTAKTAQKKAYFQPLTILEIEANHKNKGTLEIFKEIKVSYPFQSIATNIVKNTIVLFVSEIIHLSIHELEKNEPLFEFLETAIQWLDNHEKIVNFHLILMLEMTKFLGFYPDNSDEYAPFFDLNEGVFKSVANVNCVSQNESLLLKKLILLKFQSEEIKFNVSERQTLLKILIDYYSNHIVDFKKPKSLTVLKEVFS
jgi:DNA repair protein RecO (recombination protein O)